MSFIRGIGRAGIAFFPLAAEKMSSGRKSINGKEGYGDED